MVSALLKHLLENTALPGLDPATPPQQCQLWEELSYEPEVRPHHTLAGVQTVVKATRPAASSGRSAHPPAGCLPAWAGAPVRAVSVHAACHGAAGLFQQAPAEQQRLRRLEWCEGVAPCTR